MLNDIRENYYVANKKLVVNKNPVSGALIVKKQTSKNNPIQYITVGRLSKEKGIPRILKILSKIDFPFHYTIIGDGIEKSTILELIKKYGLSDKIIRIEFTRDVSKYLSNSDFFLQGSYFEGFPNCLIESCSVGTHVIAYNVPGGTKEIIIDGVNGYLVDNQAEYIEKLKESKEWIPQEVRDSVYSKFNSKIILNQYEDLFTNALID